MGAERRKSIRFIAEDNAIAVLNKKAGKIRDVSMGGLAFEYLTDYNTDICTSMSEKVARKKYPEIYSEIDKIYQNSEEVKEDCLHADIFLSGNGFHLSDVPCKMVYDAVVQLFTSTFIIKKRCAVSFETLQEDQKEKLEVFLENHTTGMAS